MSDKPKQMTEREKLAACQRLDESTDKEIGQFMHRLFGYDPFEDKQNKLMIRSEIRKRAIQVLKMSIMKGTLVGIKEG